MFKVIVAGSRGFTDYDLLVSKLDKILQDKTDVEIVSGGAKGADSMGEAYAESKGYKLTVFPADWNKYGKSAGYKRNVQMADYADVLVAFWDGQSKGTSHMIDIMREKDKPVRVIRFQEDSVD